MTITSEWTRDKKGRPIINIRKSKGKLTIEEIESEVRKLHEGLSAIVINTGDNYVGWMDEEPIGDIITVYPLEDGENCPLCGDFQDPDKLYCPQCGNKLEVKQ